MKAACVVLLALTAPSVLAQFAWPAAEHKVEPGLYTEDPFIVKYRQEFFAVFRGDFKRFERAYTEIEAMVKKDARDARALVWLGNGMTIKAASLYGAKKTREGAALAMKSRETLNRAVALRPQDPNIFMMRAATLFVQGQYFPADQVPRSVWALLRDDCEHFVRYTGPDRIKRVSLHVRGETYGEMGIAYAKLGDAKNARRAFEQVIALCPDTNYSVRAQKEIAGLSGS